MTSSPRPPRSSSLDAYDGSSAAYGLIDRAVGIRKGFGDDARVVRIAARSGLRNHLNLLIPGLAALLIAGLLLVEKFGFRADFGPAAAAWRVFVIDFVVFFFAALSGWNMVRTWRENPNQVEELSLSPLPPKVVAATFTAAPVIAWGVVLFGVALFDLLTPSMAIRGLLPFFEGGPVDATALFIDVFPSLGVHLLVTPFFLLFHFESARLAHWMFVIHAVPRVSLRRAGLLNLLAVGGIVAGLSSVGAAISLFVVLFIGLGGAILGVEVFESTSTWLFASIPGLITVAFLKRQITRIYESSFQRAWLLFQWNGAGESTQPAQYASHYHDILPFWEAYFAMVEEENANVSPHKRTATRRFQEIVAKIEVERRARQAALHPDLVPAPEADDVQRV
ncbi:MAG: hypothetical protein PWP23_2565 [Candidatus Sumerlaeota bacterium]|nr:hypothetical protein [Candidatus Sumerlaeota bacterium]